MKKDSDSVSKDAYCLYMEFVNAKDMYQKYLAFQDMQFFRDLFSNNPEIEKYYQIMSVYIKRNDVLVQEAKKKHEYAFDIYLSKHFSLLESNLPNFPFSSNNDHYQFLPLSQYNIDYLLESFFWKISHNLYRFYKQCSNKGKIFLRSPSCEEDLVGFSNNEENGLAFSSSVIREKSYVYVNKFDTLESLVSLVHEIGHAYFFNIIKYQFKDMVLPEKEIRMEIPSRTLEYLFILYLKGLHILEALHLEDKFYSRAFNERWDSDLYYRYQYTLGNLCAFSCGCRINSEISFEKYCRAVYYADFEKMVIGISRRFKNNMHTFQKQIIC